MPEAQRAPVWRAIIAAPGGPGEDFPIERAIANQIDYMGSSIPAAEKELFEEFLKTEQHGISIMHIDEPGWAY